MREEVSVLPVPLGTQLHQVLQPDQAAGGGREGSGPHDDHVPLTAAARVLAAGGQVRSSERRFPAERWPGGLHGAGRCIGGHPWRQKVDRLRWWWIA